MKPERRSSQAASLCHRRASLLLLSPRTPYSHAAHTPLTAAAARRDWRLVQRRVPGCCVRGLCDGTDACVGRRRALECLQVHEMLPIAPTAYALLPCCTEMRWIGNHTAAK